MEKLFEQFFEQTDQAKENLARAKEEGEPLFLFQKRGF